MTEKTKTSNPGKQMHMVTIYARKAHGTYIDHGVRFAEGGCCGTSDAGWSISGAIRHEEGRLNPGQAYRIERNGNLIPCFFTKAN